MHEKIGNKFGKNKNINLQIIDFHFAIGLFGMKDAKE